jgi:hypothetical protein
VSVHDSVGNGVQQSKRQIANALIRQRSESCFTRMIIIDGRDAAAPEDEKGFLLTAGVSAVETAGANK